MMPRALTHLQWYPPFIYHVFIEHLLSARHWGAGLNIQTYCCLHVGPRLVGQTELSKPSCLLHKKCIKDKSREW